MQRVFGRLEGWNKSFLSRLVVTGRRFQTNAGAATRADGINASVHPAMPSITFGSGWTEQDENEVKQR